MSILGARRLLFYTSHRANCAGKSLIGTILSTSLTTEIDPEVHSGWMQVIVKLLRWLVLIVSQQRSGRCSISNEVEQGGRIGCEVFWEEPSTASVTGTACLIVHGEQAHMRLYACMLYL